MFKEWITLTKADCEVIKFSKELNIYPIFKNGRSSLTLHAERNNIPIIKNKEISVLSDITVYIRDPMNRFVSGVHTFFYQNQLKINKSNLKKIDNNKIIDRHFVSQSFWLFHLYKFYRGDVIIKDVKEVYDIVELREGPWTNNPLPWATLTEEQEKQIKNLNYEKFVKTDYDVLYKYINKKTGLFKIIEEIKNALP
jgi:hypothetical protein